MMRSCHEESYLYFPGQVQTSHEAKDSPSQKPSLAAQSSTPLPCSSHFSLSRAAEGGCRRNDGYSTTSSNPASLSEASWLKILAVIPNQLPPTSQQEHTLGVAPICKYCSLHHGAKQHNQAGKLILSVSWKQNQDKRLPC